MKLLPSLILIFLLACSRNKDSRINVLYHDTAVDKSNATETIPDSAKKTYKNEVKGEPLIKWNSLSEVNKEWIRVERDDQGYLLYNPCDGSTPEVVIENGKISVHWQLETITLNIDKFTRSRNNTGLYIGGNNEWLIGEFDVKIVDPDKKLALWKFYIDDKQRHSSDYDIKWVMTPKEYIQEFRQEDNPCPTEKIPEKQFLPIEFE